MQNVDCLLNFRWFFCTKKNWTPVNWTFRWSFILDHVIIVRIILVLYAFSVSQRFVKRLITSYRCRFLWAWAFSASIYSPKLRYIVETLRCCTVSYMLIPWLLFLHWIIMLYKKRAIRDIVAKYNIPWIGFDNADWFDMSGIIAHYIRLFLPWYCITPAWSRQIHMIQFLWKYNKDSYN